MGSTHRPNSIFIGLFFYIQKKTKWLFVAAEFLFVSFKSIIKFKLTVRIAFLIQNLYLFTRLLLCLLNNATTCSQPIFQSRIFFLAITDLNIYTRSINSFFLNHQSYILWTDYYDFMMTIFIQRCLIQSALCVSCHINERSTITDDFPSWRVLTASFHSFD